MQKILSFILVLLVIGVIAYVAYRYYLPYQVSKSITSGQESPLLPDEVQKQVDAFKTRIAGDVGDLPVLMKRADIDYDDLKTMLDRLDPADVTRTLQEMSSVSITSVNQAFDIIVKHVDIEGYELESFRGVFVNNSSVEDIHNAMANVRKHAFLVPIAMPVAKEVAKDLLESSRQEIEKQLEALESGQ